MAQQKMKPPIRSWDGIDFPACLQVHGKPTKRFVQLRLIDRHRRKWELSLAVYKTAKQMAAWLFVETYKWPSDESIDLTISQGVAMAHLHRGCVGYVEGVALDFERFTHDDGAVVLKAMLDDIAAHFAKDGKQ